MLTDPSSHRSLFAVWRWPWWVLIVVSAIMLAISAVVWVSLLLPPVGGYWSPSRQRPVNSVPMMPVAPDDASF